MTSSQPWWLTWPVAEVAATILPLFSQSPYLDEEVATKGIVAWCKTGRYGARGAADVHEQFHDPDARAIAEAIQVLEHAALLRRTIGNRDQTDPYVGLTRRGMHALQTNTVRQHLGLGDTPPTA
jgi:hypothetical protein